jgi:AraC family transcriptional regulator
MGVIFANPMEFALLPHRTTFGRTTALKDFGGFALSVGVYEPRESVPAHQHADEYQWCLVIAGGFEEVAGRVREHCGAGSFVVRPSDCVHADRFAGRRAVCLNVFPSETWLAAHDFAQLRDCYAQHRTRRLYRVGRELAHELSAKDSAGPIAAESLVLELLSSVGRLEHAVREGRSRWFAAVLDRIEAEPGADLSLDALAADAGVSAGHLARTFRAVLGCSVGDYVRERRLAHATMLMRERGRSLADIAGAVGFHDQAHFSNAFRRKYGATPLAFRRSL